VLKLCSRATEKKERIPSEQSCGVEDCQVVFDDCGHVLDENAISFGVQNRDTFEES
jgi:hypothetical protein